MAFRDGLSCPDFYVSEYLPVGHGQHGHHEDHGDDGAEADDDAHGGPEGALAEDHGNDADGGGGGGQEDGQHAPLPGVVGGVAGGNVFLKAQIFGVLEHDDGVAHDDTHQTNQPQYAGQSEFGAGEPKPEGGAQQAEGNGGEGDQGDADFPEVDEQEEEDDEGGGGDAADDGAGDLGVALDGAAVFVFHAVGQGLGLNEPLDLPEGLPFVVPAPHVGHDAEGAHAVATDDLSFVPRGLYVGDLAQGHGNAGNGGGDVLVADPVEGGGFSFSVGFEHDGEGVVAFPEGSGGDAGVAGGEFGLGDGAVDTEPGGFDGVEPHFDAGQGFFVVGVYPHEFAHGFHAAHEAVGGLPQSGDVVAAEAYFDGGGEVLVV